MMVGVPRSKGCVGCRKRRVKCDQKSPVCYRCERNGRECSYPSNFLFVDGHETSRSGSPTASQQTTLPIRQNVYTFTTDTPAEGGGLFQKWHRTSTTSHLVINPSPPLAPWEKQSLQLIACFEQGDLGARMHWIGNWLTLVPQRIGSSAALDSSASVMVSVHTAMLSGHPPHTWIDSKVYFQAIKRLREALVDPIESRSVETLTAATILYFLEVILGSPFQMNFVLHAGGVSRLLEARGPSKQGSDFEKLIACKLQGPVSATAVQLGVPCFLAFAPWSDFFESQSNQGLSKTAVLTHKLFQQMVFWSDLAIGIRKYRGSQLSPTAIRDLRQKILKVKSCLDSIDVAVEELFASEVQEKKSVRDNQTYDTAFDFKDYNFGKLLVVQDSYALVIDRMMSILGQITSMPESKRRVLRICQSYEYAWMHRPMGAQHMHFPLTVAFPHATTETTQAWILQALNDLDEHHVLPIPRFTVFSVTHLAKVYTGESSPVVLPSQ